MLTLDISGALALAKDGSRWHLVFPIFYAILSSFYLQQHVKGAPAANEWVKTALSTWVYFGLIDLFNQCAPTVHYTKSYRSFECL